MGRKGNSKIRQWIEDTGKVDALILVEGWARSGLTDKEIYHNIGVGHTAFYTFLKTDPLAAEFQEALKRGRRPLDYIVESTLYKKAIGYTETEYVKTVEEIAESPDGTQKKQVRKESIERTYPPDITSIIFWLKNRSKTRGEWKDRHPSEDELQRLKLDNRLKELEIAEKEGRTSMSLEESGLKDTIAELVATVKESWNEEDG